MEKIRPQLHKDMFGDKGNKASFTMISSELKRPQLQQDIHDEYEQPIPSK